MCAAEFDFEFDAGDIPAPRVVSKWREFLDHVEHAKSIDQISIS
jgi:hypothetical protein